MDLGATCSRASNRPLTPQPRPLQLRREPRISLEKPLRHRLEALSDQPRLLCRSGWRQRVVRPRLQRGTPPSMAVSDAASSVKLPNAKGCLLCSEALMLQLLDEALPRERPAVEVLPSSPNRLFKPIGIHLINSLCRINR